MKYTFVLVVSLVFMVVFIIAQSFSPDVPDGVERGRRTPRAPTPTLEPKPTRTPRPTPTPQFIYLPLINK